MCDGAVRRARERTRKPSRASVRGRVPRSLSGGARWAHPSTAGWRPALEPSPPMRPPHHETHCACVRGVRKRTRLWGVGAHSSRAAAAERGSTGSPTRRAASHATRRC
eukprot:7289620-Prymnesium_polylepis.1